MKKLRKPKADDTVSPERSKTLAGSKGATGKSAATPTKGKAGAPAKTAAKPKWEDPFPPAFQSDEMALTYAALPISVQAGTLTQHHPETGLLRRRMRSSPSQSI
jgi:hypothetical protein